MARTKLKRGLGSPKVSAETRQRVARLGGLTSRGGGRPRKTE
jgi:hypothetical protein